MRVALLTSKFLPTIGGSELVIAQLANALNAARLSPVVIAPWCRGAKSYDKKFPFPVIRHRPFLTKRFGTRFYRSILPAVYKKYPFEILHIHQAYPGAILAAAFKTAVPKTKIVFTSHGDDVTREYTRFQNGYIYRQTITALSQIDGFLSLNPTLAQSFRALVDAPIPIFPITNGADNHTLSRTAASNEILYLGRLSRRKGVATLLRAFQMANLKNYTLTIAGDGKERALLEQLTSELGLKASVHFTGEVSGIAKDALLSKAKFVVIPTETWEACSLVALEAIAAGKAVIGSEISGIKELIRNDENGLLVAPGDSKELAAALRRLANDDPFRHSCEQANLKERLRYNWSTIAGNHREIYETLLATPHPAQIHHRG